MKKKIRIINMTSHGPVLDLDGDLPTKDNLGNLLIELFSRRKLPLKGQKFKVFVSRVGGDPDDPERFNETRVKTFRYLLDLWEDLDGEPFNLEDWVERVKFNIEALRKLGDKRSAWTPYIQSKQRENFIREERNYHKDLDNAKDSTEREAIISDRKRKQISPGMIIG